MSDTSWSIPIDIDDPLKPDGENVIDCFPFWNRQFMLEVAEDTQTPLGLPISLSLSVLATTLQKKIVVEGKNGWIEPVNLFTVAVMEPAERKSAVFAHMAKPIYLYEAEENKRLAPEVAKNQLEKKILEDEINHHKVKASKGSESDKIMALRKAEELSEFEDIRFIQLVADNVTLEKIVSILADNGGKISILSAEGEIFEIMLGRYSANGTCNTETILKGHAGESIRVDRKNSKSEHIDIPAITIGLAIQPKVLDGIIGNGDLRGRGMSARFLYSLPSSKVGRRNVNPKPIQHETKERYFNNIQKLLRIPLPENPNILKLSPEAFNESMKFAQELEPRFLEDLENIKDWAGKLHGAILRIAGLLHVAENIHEPRVFEMDISVNTIRKSIKLGLYFLEHAKAVFNSAGIDEGLDKARYILKRISKDKITCISQRDLFQMIRRKLNTTEALSKALDTLAEYGYINIQEVESVGKGRKPSPMIVVNPLWAGYEEAPENQEASKSNDGNDDQVPPIKTQHVEEVITI